VEIDGSTAGSAAVATCPSAFDVVAAGESPVRPVPVSSETLGSGCFGVSFASGSAALDVAFVTASSTEPSAQPEMSTANPTVEPAIAASIPRRPRGNPAATAVRVKPVVIPDGSALGIITAGGTNGGANGIDGDGNAARHAVGNSRTGPTRGSTLPVALGAGHEARQMRSPSRSSCSGSVRRTCAFTVPPSVGEVVNAAGLTLNALTTQSNELTTISGQELVKPVTPTTSRRQGRARSRR
jgi:hypothetical protein